MFAKVSAFTKEPLQYFTNKNAPLNIEKAFFFPNRKRKSEVKSTQDNHKGKLYRNINLIAFVIVPGSPPMGFNNLEECLAFRPCSPSILVTEKQTYLYALMESGCLKKCYCSLNTNFYFPFKRKSRPNFNTRKVIESTGSEPYKILTKKVYTAKGKPC